MNSMSFINFARIFPTIGAGEQKIICDNGTLNGTIGYFLDGKLHRKNGPAIEFLDGGYVWALNGKFHRKDGPAVYYPDFLERWCLNGKVHRVDGPAETFVGTGHSGNGYIKKWYLNGMLHRIDGPAVIAPNCNQYWYEGEEIRANCFEDFCKFIKNGICKNGKVTFPDGTVKYFLKGKLHRIDGPAIEYANGNKDWYFKGKLHRFDGPASYGNSNNKYYTRYCVNGKYHRHDGPAIENFVSEYGSEYELKQYYYNGNRLNITTDDELMVAIKTGFAIL